MQLDLIDKKILFELDKNSRSTYTEIAKLVRVKKETVKYRMDKLIEQHVIQGFYAVIDYAKLGFLSFRLYLTLENAGPQKQEEIIQYLLKNPNIWILYRTTGPYHITFSIWVRDQWEYETFWYDLIGKFGNNLSDYHLALVTKYTEFSRNYLIDSKEEKQQYTILQKTHEEKLDKFDFQLLELLSQNARMSLTDISKKIKLSIVSIRAHLKNLLKQKVIVGFRTMIDYDAIKYQYYKVDMWMSDPTKYCEIVGKVLSHKNVTYTEKTLVTSHFEFDLEVENFEQFIEIMDSFEKQFPGKIKKYTYYSLIKNYKISYMP